MTRDPRSEAEKARADLARNSELGLSVPESKVEREPAVTPQTFGENRVSGSEALGEPPVTHQTFGTRLEGETFGDSTENARVRNPMDRTAEQVEASRDIGDSTGTIATSRDIPVDPAHVDAPPTHRSSDEDDDVLSRAKE
ncbi:MULTISPECIES: hypothetical protein [Microvirga]|uniref:hypothetical protein n=1 Tax=Microvirga TaxID=186650 RepID=UPI001CFD3FEF|nr:hypothetical protein [Microvirga lenta]MCB5174366.1 hypothetical protein [Microvirga lenta]